MQHNALVLGASGDIGQAVVRKLAKTGYDVVLHYSSNEDKVKELQKILRNTYQGRKFNTYQLNFANTKIEELDKFTDKIMLENDAFDVIVNCAGMMSKFEYPSTDVDEVRKIFDVNVIVPMMVIRPLFNKMMRATGGVIVNVSSFVTKYGMGRNKTLDYSMSKAALENFTIGLSRIGAPKVRCNCVSPGITDTKMQQGRSDLFQRMELNPLRRMASVDEIVDGIMFCINNKFLNSEIVKISGGE